MRAIQNEIASVPMCTEIGLYAFYHKGRQDDGSNDSQLPEEEKNERRNRKGSGQFEGDYNGIHTQPAKRRRDQKTN